MMGNPGYSKRGDLMVESKEGLDAMRSLRDMVVRMAFRLSDEQDKYGILLLVDPGISDDSLKEEWQKYATVFQLDVIERLAVSVYREGRPRLLFGEIPDYLLNRTKDYVPAVSDKPGDFQKLPDPDYSGEILRLLIYLWLLNAESPSGSIVNDPADFAESIDPGIIKPQAKGFTFIQISKAAGTSYRTVARAIEEIGASLVRYSDRSIALTSFPRRAWEKLVVLADESRSTRFYVDRSGNPRSQESILKRLQSLSRDDIAIGGVRGAVRIYPDLDIVGSPRLDLHIHAPGKHADLDFLRKLDPALQESTTGESTPSLAIHFLRRAHSLFKKDELGYLWAGPVECLLDLRSARLDHQALQLRNAILPEDAY